MRLHKQMQSPILPTQTQLSQAITHIVEQLQAPLRSFIRGRIGSREDTEDLLQELWFQLSKKLAQEKLDDPKAWLYRVARNKIIDHYRRQPLDWLEEYYYAEDEEEGYENDAIFATDQTAEDIFMQTQFWEELYEALEELPEKQREVFVLHEMEGITLREIAERKGDKLKTIISRKRYAVQQLREHLQFLFEDWIGEID
jgi:RNA polymerase sigma factor (sigma-70 family)